MALAALGLPSATADGFRPHFGLEGLADIRLVYPSEEASVFGGGFGKLRFGTEEGAARRFDAEIEEIALVGRAQFAPAWFAHVHIQHNPSQANEVDVVEGFVRYRPASTSRWRWGARAGAWFPPVSFENQGVAWSNLFTLTNSAANTWIAEESRLIGAEAILDYRGDSLDLTFRVGPFFANDRSGTALALRGFTLNDQNVGLFGELRIADLPMRQGVETRPFNEIDGRPGYALHLQLDHISQGELLLNWVDNRGDPLAVGEDGRAWDMYYLNAAYLRPLPAGFLATAQILWGQARTAPTGDPDVIMGTDFLTASGLISWRWRFLELNARGEFFRQIDLTRLMPAPPFAEDGFAVTAAAMFRFGAHHRLTLEYVASRADRAGGPANTRIDLNENSVQLGYRFVF